MKKLGLLVMPLMAVSFLASCGGPNPTTIDSYIVDFNGADCTATKGGKDFTCDNIKADTEVTLEITPKVEERFELDDTITFLVNGEPSSAYTYTKVTGTDKYSLVFTVTGKTEIYASTTEYCWLSYECDPGTKDSVKIKKGNEIGDYLTPAEVPNFTFYGWYNESELEHKCYPTQKIYEDMTVYAKLVRGDINAPFTFVCTDDGGDGASVSLYADASSSNVSHDRNLKYKLNDGDWTPIAGADDNGDFTIAANFDDYISILPNGVTLEEGDVIQFKGDNVNFSYDSKESMGSNMILSFATSNDDKEEFDICGNIMSLIDSENFATLTTISGEGCLECLFAPGWSSVPCNIVNANNLVLPAMNLSYSCYFYMFGYCEKLIKAPIKLPATTLVESCYWDMFHGCSKLVDVPELPATNLAESCYDSMFNECSSLVKAPDLPATTLAKGCYCWMFNECSKLEYVKVGFGNPGTDDWPNTENTYQFLGDAGADAENEPVFEWKGTDVLTDIHWDRDDNHVPSNWDIKSYS